MAGARAWAVVARMSDERRSEYRLSPALLARLAGTALAVTGVAVAVMTLLAAVVGLPRQVLLVCGGVALLVAAALATGARRGVRVVQLGEHGYRVRLVRGAGVRQARWRDVEDVVVTTVAGDRCVVLRLRDGRATTIPLRVLNVPSRDLVRELQRRLDRGHGYRQARR